MIPFASLWETLVKIDPEKLKLIVKAPAGNEITSKLTIKDGEPQVHFVPKRPGLHKGEFYKGVENLRNSD